MDVSDWIYRGEGNASLVVANTKNNKVYKIRKKKIANNDCNDFKTGNCEDSLQKCTRMLQYSELILRPLLGEQLVPKAEIVSISKDFIRSIREKVRLARPPKRLNTKIDEDSNYAICLPDLCFIPPSNVRNSNPVFCIEIKPKMGFLPDSNLISEERSIKRSACKFCMYQKLKVKNGVWDSASLYCPLDLFSGNEDRMMYALRSLVQTPQNNLGIFMNGQLIFSNSGRCSPNSEDHQELIDVLKTQFGNKSTDEESKKPLKHSCLSDFLHLIQKVLVAPDNDRDTRLRAPCAQPLTTKHCHASLFNSKVRIDSYHSSLPSSCVLGRILKVQRYDDLDIEGIYPLYQRLQKHLSKQPQDSKKYCLEGPFNQHFIDQLQTMNWTKSNCFDEYTIDETVQKIREFLISATSKDCSVMITLQQSTGTNIDDSILSSSGRTFAYQCRIVDLDPKPSDRIPMYYKLDEEITQYYKEFCEKQNILF